MTNNPSIRAAFTFVIQSQRSVSSIVALAFLVAFCAVQPVVAQTVTTVSAASYDANALAPDGIASAFGTKLATQTASAPSTPLPTTLGGTTVRINGMLAQLFYVSPEQVNFLIPASIAPGAATVQITAGDGSVSNGTMQVKQTAPAIFTANSEGNGVPSAYLTRVLANGQQVTEPVAEIDPVTGKPVPKAISPGAATDRVFLILFVTGVRGADDPNKDGNLNENVHVLFGGRELTPDYVGKHAVYIGIDQINLELPRDLFGSGRMSFSVLVKNGSVSNLPEIEMGATAGTNAPQILNFSSNTVLAGQTLTINGNNFAATPAGNLVRIGGVEARVTAASLSQLQIVVPFGAVSGPVTVRTAQGEGRSSNSLTVRTSLSGLVVDTSGQPLNGVAVRLSGTTISATTNSEGTFILPDVTAGTALVEVDATTIATPPFPKVTLSQKVTTGRDNPFGRPIALQQATGTAIPVSTGSSLVAESTVSVSAATTEAATDVQFIIPPGAKATFPAGVTPGPLYVTVVENSQTPAPLPPSIFSSVIVQITPIGTTLTPGGKLIFPNTDKLTAGSQARLYKLDQKTGSPTIGTFIDVGAATVSADGMQIETATNAITEMTYYFVAIPSTSTTIVGRVTDSDKTTPVRNASVQVRGQSTTTDGNGAFIVREVPVRQGDQLTIDVSYTRPNGRVDRVQRSGINPVISSLTIVTPDLVLPSEASNRPPVLVVPGAQTVTVGTKLSFSVTASDPDEGQLVVVSASGLPTGAVFSQGQFMWTPTANQVGSYTVSFTATDNGAPSLSTTKTLTTTVTAAPELSWEKTSGPTGGDVHSIVSNGIYLFAGTDLGGVFRSSDNGISWAAINTGLTSLYVRSLAVSGSTLFAWTNGGGMFRSTDNGTNWALLNIGITNTFVNVFAVNGATIFAGTTNGVIRSSDNGANWMALNTGLVNQDVRSLAVMGTTVFAGTFSGGVFRSTDNGTTWSTVYTSSAIGSVNALAVSSTTIFAGTGNGGVLRSTDNGMTWMAVNNGRTNLYTISLAVNETTIFAGSYGAIFRSTDNGTTWTAANINVKDQFVQSLTVNGATVFAGVFGAFSGGIFRSTDNGTTWTAANTGLMGQNTSSLAVNETTIFAGTDGGAIFRSTDNGITWTTLNTGQPFQGRSTTRISDLAINGTTIFAGTGGGVLRSMDNGTTWVAVNTGLTNLRINSLAGNETTMFAGTDGGVFRSTDNGMTWTPINTGLTIQTIAALAVNGPVIFAATYGGGNGTVSGSIFRSTDNGTTWTVVRTQYVEALAMNGTTVFAAIGGVILRSTDNGTTWTEMNSGLIYPRALAVSGATVFAGDGFIGVFRSTDNGSTWVEFNAGLTNLGVTALKVRGTTIFAGTAGSSVFRKPLP